MQHVECSIGNGTYRQLKEYADAQCGGDVKAMLSIILSVVCDGRDYDGAVMQELGLQQALKGVSCAKLSQQSKK